MALKGVKFKADEIPKLPLAGCKSQTGCACRLDSMFANDNDEDEQEDGENTILLDDKIDSQTPLENLRQLKAMLDEGLISQTEYQDKKQGILSRI